MLGDTTANLEAITTPEIPTNKWFDVIEEGYKEGYLNTETTLTRYKDIYYFPEIFDRSNLKSYMYNRNCFKTENRLREEAIAKIESFSYEPNNKSKIEKVQHVYNKAWQKFGRGKRNPFVNAFLFL